MLVDASTPSDDLNAEAWLRRVRIFRMKLRVNSHALGGPVLAFRMPGTGQPSGCICCRIVTETATEAWWMFSGPCIRGCSRISVANHFLPSKIADPMALSSVDFGKKAWGETCVPIPTRLAMPGYCAGRTFLASKAKPVNAAPSMSAVDPASGTCLGSSSRGLRACATQAAKAITATTINLRIRINLTFLFALSRFQRTWPGNIINHHSQKSILPL